MTGCLGGVYRAGAVVTAIGRGCGRVSLPSEWPTAKLDSYIEAVLGVRTGVGPIGVIGSHPITCPWSLHSSANSAEVWETSSSDVVWSGALGLTSSIPLNKFDEWHWLARRPGPWHSP